MDQRQAARLTERQRRFVEEYGRLGNATRAAIAAGYSTKSANRTGQVLTSTPMVAQAIRELTDRLAEARIANGAELRRFWTTVLRDEGCTMRDRLKASELLGRAAGEFIERSQPSADLFMIGPDWRALLRTPAGSEQLAPAVNGSLGE